MNTQLSAKITLWCNRLIILAMLALIFFFPSLLNWYKDVRPIRQQVADIIFYTFYICVPVVLYALWCIDRLVCNILKKAVFVRPNVSYIRRVRWCCAGVSLICVPAAFFYQPLLFMVVIMGFLSLVVSLVKNILAAAVEIREENDLTI